MGEKRVRDSDDAESDMEDDTADNYCVKHARGSDESSSEQSGWARGLHELRIPKELQWQTAEKKKTVTNEPEGGDDVFWSLIERFADLALPDDAKTALETCPLCSKQLVAADFATHVEACVRALDEKDEAESLREAKRLAAREGPQDHTFKPVDCCPLGSACTSRFLNHFQLLYHPPIDCPVCGEEVERIEAEAHLLVCSGKPTRGPATAAATAATAAGTKDADAMSDVGDEDGKAPSMGNAGRARLSAAQIQAMSRLLLEHKTANERGLASRARGFGSDKVDGNDKVNHQGKDKNHEGDAAMVSADGAAACDEKKTEEETDGGGASLCDLLSSFSALGLTAERLDEELRAAVSTASSSASSVLALSA